MRVRLALIPIAVAAALVSGCTSTGTPGGQSTPTPTASPTAAADNGVAALSATEISSKAIAAATSAPSIHFVGQQNAQNQLDLNYSKDKTLGKVVVSGNDIEVRIIGGDLYLKTSASGYAQFLPGSVGVFAGQQYGGKWAHTTSSNAAFAGILATLSPMALLKVNGSLTKGETKTIDGQPAIAIKDSDTNKGSTIWVATTGEPRPILMEPNVGGSIKITYGDPISVEKPPAAETVEAKLI